MYNNQDSQQECIQKQEFSSNSINNNPTSSSPVGLGSNPTSSNSIQNNNNSPSNNSSRLYSKYNNNLVQTNENSGLFNGGIRNNKQQMDEQQRMKQYYNEYKQVRKISMLKFIYSEKATKFCEISTLLLSYVVPVKGKMEISQNIVAFSEYMYFKWKKKLERFE